MINVQKLDIAGMAFFGLLGIGALVGVFFGAKHQWLMFLMCAIVVVTLLDDYRKEKPKK